MQLGSVLYPILAFSALVSAAEGQINVFGKSLNSGTIIELGHIKYDTDANTTLYDSVREIPSHDSLCFGTKSLPNRECFSYIETKEATPKGTFTLFVNEEREILDIAFRAGEEWTIEFADVAAAPLPNLEPFVRQAQKQKNEPVKQKVIVKKVVEIDGKQTEIEEEVEEEVPVDNRLWLQKNWLWVVVPLVLFMIMSPEEEKK